ncbi:hypothetical protein QJS66_07315 [Kocuria rhizophila]|nr:hypothetical protein QJS66_07315 [Kocuria rhizophila]
MNGGWEGPRRRQRRRGRCQPDLPGSGPTSRLIQAPHRSFITG